MRFQDIVQRLPKAKAIPKGLLALTHHPSARWDSAGPGTAGPAATRLTTVYSSCAGARAAQRWNILKTDADYSPSLDRDNDGIACEAGSNGASSGGDPDPVGTVSTDPGTVSYTPTPWALVGQTYPEWLGQHLA